MPRDRDDEKDYGEEEYSNGYNPNCDRCRGTGDAAIWLALSWRAGLLLAEETTEDDEREPVEWTEPCDCNEDYDPPRPGESARAYYMRIYGLSEKDFF